MHVPTTGFCHALYLLLCTSSNAAFPLSLHSTEASRVAQVLMKCESPAQARSESNMCFQLVTNHVAFLLLLGEVLRTQEHYMLVFMQYHCISLSVLKYSSQ